MKKCEHDWILIGIKPERKNFNLPPERAEFRCKLCFASKIEFVSDDPKDNPEDFKLAREHFITLDDSLNELERWWCGKDLDPDNEKSYFRRKGRYLHLNINTTYGATEWEVVLGNCNVKHTKDWYQDFNGDRDNIKRTEVVAVESGTEGDTNKYPNFVYASDYFGDDYGQIGLNRTIQAALAKAEELGL